MKKTALSLCRYADVSTCHVTRLDDRALREDANLSNGQVAGVGTPRLVVYGYDEGYFVHTGAAEDEEALSARYSESLIRIVREAREAGATFVRFDSDGDEYDGYETYDW